MSRQKGRDPRKRGAEGGPGGMWYGVQVLHAHLASSLERQEEGDDRRKPEQSSRRVDDGRRLFETGDHGDDGCEDSHDPVGRPYEGVPGTSVQCGESLRGAGVEDGVHDVLGETVRAVPSEQSLGTGGERRSDQEGTRHKGRSGEGSLSTETRELDEEGSGTGTRDTSEGDVYSVEVGGVAIRASRRNPSAPNLAFEILGESAYVDPSPNSTPLLAWI